MEHFKNLNSLDVSDKIEKKKTGSTELSYLSWAWAWGEVKKKYPDANYVIERNEKGLPFFQDEELGYMVFTNVTIEGLTHNMWLPVMDGSNKSMKSKSYKYSTKFGEKTVEACSMFDINKTLMRCLTKNLAMFGLGLYIYAGEDLPENQDNNEKKKESEKEENKIKEYFLKIVKGRQDEKELVEKFDSLKTEQEQKDFGAYIKNQIKEKENEYVTNSK